MSFKVAGSGVTTLHCSCRACKADVLYHLKCPEGTNKAMQERMKQEELCHCWPQLTQNQNSSLKSESCTNDFTMFHIVSCSDLHVFICFFCFVLNCQPFRPKQSEIQAVNLSGL